MPGSLVTTVTSPSLGPEVCTFTVYPCGPGSYRAQRSDSTNTSDMAGASCDAAAGSRRAISLKARRSAPITGRALRGRLERRAFEQALLHRIHYREIDDAGFRIERAETAVEHAERAAVIVARHSPAARPQSSNAAASNALAPANSAFTLPSRPLPAAQLKRGVLFR